MSIKDADQGPFLFPGGQPRPASSTQVDGRGAPRAEVARRDDNERHGEVVTLRLPSQTPKPSSTSRGFGALGRFRRNWAPTSTARAPLPAPAQQKPKNWQPPQPKPVTAGPQQPESSRETIIRENTRAAQLTSDDARVIFATKVQDSLEGGKAAILRPDRRRALMTLSSQLRLRPFDANLIIALVQDAARRGEVIANVSSTQPPSHVREMVEADEARVMLALMAPAAKDTTQRDRVIFAVVLALAILAMLVALVGP